MKLGNIEEIRNQLTGKTELLPEFEEALIEKIARIEAEGGAGAPLTKLDRLLIAALTIFSIVITVVCFSWA